MDVIYFSGFASITDENSTKVKMLKELASNVGIVSAITNTVDNYLRNFEAIYRPESRTVLVGTSLGGFWASYLGQLHNCPWIGLNPVVYPSVALKKHIGDVNVYDSQETFECTEKDCDDYAGLEVQSNRQVPGLVIVARDDDVLDHDVVSQINQAQLEYIERRGHRLSNTEDYKHIIKNYLGCLPNFEKTEIT